MRKQGNKHMSRSNKQIFWIVGFSVIGLILLSLIVYLLFFNNDKLDYNNGRCSDKEAYLIEDEQKEKIENIFKELEEVESVSIFTNVCTVKTIVRLTKDVELDKLQEKATAMLDVLDDGQKKYFDYALYVTSSEDSEVFPINVMKNKNRSDFAW